MRKTGAVVATAALLAALSGMGCAFGEVYWSDPFKREVSLNDLQREYTRLVRWGEFAKAATFVAPQAREQFLRSMPTDKNLRFTDFENGHVDIDDETGDATVEVTYLAYRTSSPIEIRVRETQHWSRSGIGNDWKVRPEFEGPGSPDSASARR